MTTDSGSDTVTYYVAEVAFTDVTALRSAFAEDTYGTNLTETTSGVTEGNDAAFAVNGNYCGFRDTGIVIRDGVVSRDEGSREGLAFYLDRPVEVYDETATTADELVAEGVWNTLSFGPPIVEGSEVVESIEAVEIDTNIWNLSS